MTLLLEKNPDVNITDFLSCTPLHYSLRNAIQNKDLKIVRLLLMRNPRTDIKDFFGITISDLIQKAKSLKDL